MNYFAFNLKASGFKFIPGIGLQMNDENPDFFAILLGEKGRGRKYTVVPCPPDVKDKDLVTPGLTKSERTRINRSNSNDPAAGWMARISTAGAYIRNAHGHCRYFSLTENAPSVLAEGHGAFGDAGRIGYWQDAIFLIPFQSILRVKPSRGDATYLYFSHNEVIDLGYREDARTYFDMLDIEVDWENSPNWPKPSAQQQTMP